MFEVHRESKKKHSHTGSKVKNKVFLQCNFGVTYITFTYFTLRTSMYTAPTFLRSLWLSLTFTLTFRIS